MTDERKSKCSMIIHATTAASIVLVLGVSGGVMFAGFDGLTALIVGLIVVHIVMIWRIGAAFGQGVLSSAMHSISGFMMATVACGLLLLIGRPEGFFLVTEGTGWLLYHSLATKEKKQNEAQKNELPAESSVQ